MARSTKLLASTKGLLMREANRFGGNQQHYLMSRLAAAQIAPIEQQYDQEVEQPNIERDLEEDPRQLTTNVDWVPHPRSGIYYPKGQDWVMDDVPNHAASLGQGKAYWLRNIDGVEKHDPDIPFADHYMFDPHHV